MMNSNWIVLPILIPAALAALIVLLGRFHTFITRVFSVFSAVCLLGVSGVLLYMSASGEVYVYSLGNWAAPYGIVLVLDRLSALMVGLTSIISFGVLLYTLKGWDLKGKHFHSLFQFQLMGINGAFLTGDLFNLFVFFEVLLIASYGLMVHGGGVDRIRSGIQYVIINLIGSAFFLIAAGLIYSVLGTLNMADLSVKASQVASGDMAILNTGAILLLLVFSIKSALVPVHFWLPATYAHAPALVAALFALLTKVGAYCILRVYILIFPEVASSWVLFGAMVTLVVGVLGVLASRTLGQMISFYMISSMGTLLIAFGQFTKPSVEAGLYYLCHSTLIGALLFLTVDLVKRFREKGLGARSVAGSAALAAEAESAAEMEAAAETGNNNGDDSNSSKMVGDALQSGSSFNKMGALSLIFFIFSIAAVGLPPLSGFLGKIMILQSSFSHPLGAWIWATILITSLLSLIGFSRAGSQIFWKSTEASKAKKDESKIKKEANKNTSTHHGDDSSNQNNDTLKIPWAPLGVLFSGVLILTIFAGPAAEYFSLVAEQVMNTQIYIEAVLGKPEVRP